MNLSLIKFLITLKNNSIFKKESFTYKSNKTVLAVLYALYREGYIQSFKPLNDNNVCIYLRHNFNKPIFKDLKILSTPAHRRYLTFNSLLLTNTSAQKTIFVSTVAGVKTLLECKQQKCGGQLLFVC